MFDKKTKKLTLLILSLLLVFPIVSAYNGWGYGWSSPAQLLENEWVVFGLIFLVVFAMTFYALSRTMKENIGAVVVISAAVGLFISVAVSQRTFYYGYVGETIGNYLLIVAIILGAIILIKAVFGLIGGIGLFICFGLLHFIFKSIDPYNILPYGVLSSSLLPVWEFLAGGFLLFLIIVAFIIVLLLAYSGQDSRRKEWWQKWLWAKKEKEPYWPWKR